MSITYTAGWLTLWRGLFYMTFCHPRRLWLIPFLLLPLPFLVWIGTDFWIAAGIIGVWAGFWIGFLLFAIVVSAVTQTGKSCTTTLSEVGLRDELWPRHTVIRWSAVTGIICVQGSVFLFRRGIFAATFLPASAFSDPRQTQQFYEQSIRFWREAKGLPPLVPDTAGVWPPAPRPGNSAEPGDGPECY